MRRPTGENTGDLRMTARLPERRLHGSCMGTQYDIQLLIDLVQNYYPLLLLLRKRLFLWGDSAPSTVLL